jgi:hypothetical protein
MLISLAIYAQGCMESKSDEGVSVVGYLQAQYEYKFHEEDDTNAFTFNRARMGLVGNIPYDFSYYIMYEFSPNKGGAPYLLDGFITYSRFAPWVSVSMGQFKSPFSLELNTPCQGLHTINRSNVVGALAIPFRDRGLLFSGKYKELLKYAFAVTNGTGRSEDEDNTNKDYLGRIVLNPIKMFSVGGSFGMRTLIPASEGASEDDKINKYAVEFQVDYENILVQAEYLSSDYESSGGVITHPPDCTHPDEWYENIPAGTTTSNGYWAQAMYLFEDLMIQPVVKYEFYDPNEDTDDDAESIITFGFNYFFNDWTRLQLNYLYKAEEEEVSNDEILMQLQVKF